jgi:hypothetical protein
MNISRHVQAREPFSTGHLRGAPVTPYNQTPAYGKSARGSAARIFAGALSEHGTAGVTGAGSLLPELGELDPAPAMFHAIGEADYIIWSYETPVAWHLGPEVSGAEGPGGNWIEVMDFGREYGYFSQATARHQHAVHRAIAGEPA